MAFVITLAILVDGILLKLICDELFLVFGLDFAFEFAVVFALAAEFGVELFVLLVVLLDVLAVEFVFVFVDEEDELVEREAFFNPFPAADNACCVIGPKK